MRRTGGRRSRPHALRPGGDVRERLSFRPIPDLDRAEGLVYNHSFRSQPAKSRLGTAPRAGFALPAKIEHAFAASACAQHPRRM